MGRGSGREGERGSEGERVRLGEKQNGKERERGGGLGTNLDTTGHASVLIRTRLGTARYSFGHDTTRLGTNLDTTGHVSCPHG